jgi:hypothetical protein
MSDVRIENINKYVYRNRRSDIHSSVYQRFVWCLLGYVIITCNRTIFTFVAYVNYYYVTICYFRFRQKLIHIFILLDNNFKRSIITYAYSLRISKIMKI